MSTFPKWLGWTVVLALLATLVGAFLVVGSPWEARKRAADERRVQDLDTIAYALVQRYQNTGRLPEDLVRASEGMGLNKSFLYDPVTRRPYEYRRLSKDRFELCAVFETDTRKTDDRDSRSPWVAPERSKLKRHASGRVCFELSADPKTQHQH